jgi:hypothetical protein
MGPPGEDGADGVGLQIRGWVPEAVFLPDTGAPGDGWIVQEHDPNHLYVWDVGLADWNDVGVFQGEDGDQGPQGPAGPQGIPGPVGLSLKGSIASVAALEALPGPHTFGDAYVVQEFDPDRLYMWNGTEWDDMGQFQGPAGEQGVAGMPGAPGEDGTDGTDGAPGAPGAPGADGAAGQSAYDIAVDNGFVGSEAAWLASLEGEDGPQGPQGPAGTSVEFKGTVADLTALNALPGPHSVGDGYIVQSPAPAHLWVWNGASFDDAGQIQGPTGATGPTGAAGPAGADGDDGADGADGAPGLSAYQVAVANGFVGTEAAWLASLEGDPGPTGPPGPGGGTSSVYDNVAAAAAATIPSTTKVLWTSGYSVQGKGAAMYQRTVAPTGALVGNRGFFQNTVDASWWRLDLEQGIKVTHFGALGDNGNDDGPAIRSAHDFCANANRGGVQRYIPLNFPAGQYNIKTGTGGTLATPGFVMVDNMHWVGEGAHDNEQDDRVQIRYGPDSAGAGRHMFSFGGTVTPTNDRSWCSFTGISFDGKNQKCNMIDSAVDGSGNPTAPKLWHTTFLKCGFKNFDHAFKNVFSGVWIKDCYFQNNLCGLHTAGADCYIQDNVMSGSNWHSVGSNSDSAGATTFAVKLGSWRMSWFERNFITGWPQMPMRIYGSVECTNFNYNRFDICDMAGLFIENSRGGTFIGNTFNRCMLGTDPVLGGSQSAAVDNTDPTGTDYNAIVRIKNSHNMNFSNNTFGYVDNGLPNGTISPTTFWLSGSGTVKNRINNSTYLNYTGSAYVKSIVTTDSAAAPVET